MGMHPIYCSIGVTQWVTRTHCETHIHNVKWKTGLILCILQSHLASHMGPWAAACCCSIVVLVASTTTCTTLSTPTHNHGRMTSHILAICGGGPLPGSTNRVEVLRTWTGEGNYETASLSQHSLSIWLQVLSDISWDVSVLWCCV